MGNQTQEKVINQTADSKPKPKGVDPAAEQTVVEKGTEEETLYLGDLAEKEFAALAFKKNCNKVVNGEKTPKGLLLHPAENGSAHVIYDIGGRFHTFKATVGISDEANGGAGSASPLTFIIEGDNKQLWKSRPLQRAGEIDTCEIAVEGTNQLTLRVECRASINFAHAVWVEPRILGNRTIKQTIAARPEGKPGVQRPAKDSDWPDASKNAVQQGDVRASVLSVSVDFVIWEDFREHRSAKKNLPIKS